MIIYCRQCDSMGRKVKATKLHKTKKRYGRNGSITSRFIALCTLHWVLI